MSEGSGVRRWVAVGVTIGVVVKVHERLRALLWSSSKRRGRVRTVRAVSASGHGERAVRLFARDEAHQVNRPLDALAAVALRNLAPSDFDRDMRLNALLSDLVDQDRADRLAHPERAFVRGELDLVAPELRRGEFALDRLQFQLDGDVGCELNLRHW